MTPRSCRGFTLIELLVVVSLIALLIAILVPSLARAREQARKVYCASNLSQFGRAVYIYTGEYRFFPPHNPLPNPWWPTEAQTSGVLPWDPNVGWLLTHGMRMAPPEKFANGHFKWFVLNEDDLPEVVQCPSARRELMFTPSSQLDPFDPWESFVYQYAAFYQTSGTCRSILPRYGKARVGSRNPVIPDPGREVNFGNCVGSTPCVDLRGADGRGGGVVFVQAIEPSELDNPGRVYYLADTREYRSIDDTSGAPGTKNSGWLTELDYVLLGSRHSGWANVLYLDGRVTADAQGHGPDGLWWPVDPNNRTEYRAATFSDRIQLANIGNQHHIMPVLQIKGWEYFLSGK